MGDDQMKRSNVPCDASQQVRCRTIREAREGSEAALERLYTDYSRFVYRTAFRILLSDDEAQDAVQDVFVGLPEALRHFDERRELEPWLHTVTVRFVLMHMRAERRLKERHTRSVHQQTLTDRHPLDVIGFQETLGTVPHPLRLVFTLKEMEGYSNKEIAAMLDISAAAVATRLHRAWRLIKARVQ